MELLIIENPSSKVIFWNNKRLCNMDLRTIGWWKITFYIVPDIKSNVRISVGTFVVAQQFVLQRNTMKFDIIVIWHTKWYNLNFFCSNNNVNSLHMEYRDYSDTIKMQVAVKYEFCNDESFCCSSNKVFVYLFFHLCKKCVTV